MTYFSSSSYLQCQQAIKISTEQLHKLEFIINARKLVAACLAVTYGWAHIKYLERANYILLGKYRKYLSVNTSRDNARNRMVDKNIHKKIWDWCERQNNYVFASDINTKENIQVDVESRSRDIETEYCDGLNKRIIWGVLLSFNPQGKFHPMTFLKKLKRILNDAGVPEPYKVSLAVTCLKGTAADWAAIEEQIFTFFTAFEQMFRFWGVDKQRDLFLQLNYGHYELGGSRYARNQCKVLKNQLYESYIADIDNKLTNDPLSFWRYINSKKKSYNSPVRMTYKNTSAESSIETANLFAEYFAKIFISMRISWIVLDTLTVPMSALIYPIDYYI
nr:unnamed protein product [Callosobruchus chinensis]